MSKETEQTTLEPSAVAEAAAKTPGRRSMLGTGAAAAASVILGSLVAACGDDDGSDTDAGLDGGGNDAGRGGAGTGAGGAGTGAGGAGAGAAGVDADSGIDDDAAVPGPDADIEPLNALLTAEYNAITAYTAGAGLITNADAGDPLYALRTVIVDIAVDFQSHHKLHAKELVAAIKELGGTAVKEADVAKKFKAPKGLTDNPTISNVLKFAASAERGAAVAYNQVLAGLEDAKYRFLASSIEGDESQHFIVLAALVLGLAAPGPNLSSTTADDVVPEAFVTTTGKNDGLNDAPADYFS